MERLRSSGSNNSTSSLPEQLFLDICVQDVLDNTVGMSLAEPWATNYVESLRDGRYGDAIWARYHIAGDVEEGIIDDDSGNKTVLEVIEEDARGYRVNDADLYTDALSFYSQTSNEDSHATDVLALLRRIGEEDITELEKDYETRKTFGISCSGNNLAFENSCSYLICYMGEDRALLGNLRGVYSYGNCYLRVGPYRGAASDVSEWTAQAVAILINQNCDFVPACCTYKVVSGYSPKNSGHRKICLSSKNSGCS
ncbi:hypothetical protein BDV12DRAFT_191352 [Aspergillus spectabilis]